MAAAPFVLVLLLLLRSGQAPPPTVDQTGFPCLPTPSLYPCRSFAVYRPATPNLLDLAAIADLFSTSPLSIARATGTNLSAPLSPSQPVLVPLTCSCHRNRSFSPIPHQIKKGDTFYLVSTVLFQNLTTYQAVELLNPSLVPTNLSIGVEPFFPVFCRCPPQPFSSVYFLTYVVQPSDTYASIAAAFGADVKSIISVNGKKLISFSTIFVPISRVPLGVSSPEAPPPSPPGDGVNVAGSADSGGRSRSGAVVIVLAAVSGVLLALLMSVVWLWSKERRTGGGRGNAVGTGRGAWRSGEEESFMADIGECLDKYRVYNIGDLRRATSNFDRACVVEGSVYKGWLDGEAYAIKKMKWNATQELRILQKVNHSNLVKLEGFCIDPEDGTSYLVYEFLGNGSLDSWLHDQSKHQKLNWKIRLKIALDVANGLQYIHEHTWPTVVHKDITSSNVLLDGNMRAKIANFGLARSGCNAMTTHIVGTQGYVAPEYLLDGLVTTKLDVFAFGVVLLELVSGSKVIDEDGKALWMDIDKLFDAEGLAKDDEIKKWMDTVLVEAGCQMDSVVNVMYITRACLHRDPHRRPNMVDIVYMLSRDDDSSSGVYCTVGDAGFKGR